MLRDRLRRCATSYPEKVAYYQGERSQTWSQVHERSVRFAAALQRLGVRKGDAVAILSRECIEVYEHFYACMIIGAVRVGVNWRYSPAEMVHVLANSDVKVCVVEDICIDSLAGVLDEQPVKACRLIGLGAGHGLPHDYEQLLADSDGRPDEPAIDREDPLLHTYTSGVTGSPKAVVLSHRAIETELMIMQPYFGLRSNDIWYMPAQSAWVAVVANVVGLIAGMTCVIPDGMFEMSRYLEDVERRRVSVGLLVPTMMKRLVEMIDKGSHHDFSSLKRITYGSAPATPALIRDVDRTLGVDLVQLYGMTECVAWACFLQPDEHRRGLAGEPDLLRSSGRFATHVDWRICDDDGRDVPRGEAGTVWLKGDNLMSGYLNLPEETREVMLPDGWYITNDIGRVDDQGFVYLLDRRKFLINTGGVNVFPAQVEAVLANEQSISDVMVVGVPHPEWGEAVVAAVVAREGATDVRERVLDHCRRHLSKLEAPKHVELMEVLPRTTNGKPDKKALIAHFNDKVALPWNAPRQAMGG